MNIDHINKRQTYLSLPERIFTAPVQATRKPSLWDMLDRFENAVMALLGSRRS